jgi:hypothetical protein
VGRQFAQPGTPSNRKSTQQLLCLLLSLTQAPPSGTQEPAAAVAGAATQRITGNASIVANPTFMAASRLLIPVKGDR